MFQLTTVADPVCVISVAVKVVSSTGSLKTYRQTNLGKSEKIYIK